MTTQKLLVYRVGLGKIIGLSFGLIGYFTLPLLVAEPSMLFQVGIVLWYTTLGAIVGLVGIFAHHPILKISFPWWVRGFLVGAWMNLVLTFLAYSEISDITIATTSQFSFYVSPFWMVLEGGLIGLLIDYITTRCFGDGWADTMELD